MYKYIIFDLAAPMAQIIEQTLALSGKYKLIKKGFDKENFERFLTKKKIDLVFTNEHVCREVHKASMVVLTENLIFSIPHNSNNIIDIIYNPYNSERIKKTLRLFEDQFKKTKETKPFEKEIVKYIYLNTAAGFVKLSAKRIKYIEESNNNLKVYTTDSQINVLGSIKSYYEILRSLNFKVASKKIIYNSRNLLFLGPAQKQAFDIEEPPTYLVYN